MSDANHPELLAACEAYGAGPVDVDVVRIGKKYGTAEGSAAVYFLSRKFTGSEDADAWAGPKLPPVDLTPDANEPPFSDLPLTAWRTDAAALDEPMGVIQVPKDSQVVLLVIEAAGTTGAGELVETWRPARRVTISAPPALVDPLLQFRHQLRRRLGRPLDDPTLDYEMCAEAYRKKKRGRRKPPSNLAIATEVGMSPKTFYLRRKAWRDAGLPWPPPDRPTS